MTGDSSEVQNASSKEMHPLSIIREFLVLKAEFRCCTASVALGGSGSALDQTPRSKWSPTGHTNDRPAAPRFRIKEWKSAMELF